MGSEAGGDYDPGPWKGWSASDARRAYDMHAGRGYGDSASGSLNSLSERVKANVPAKIKTDSPSPLIVAVDVTGSMKEWPKIIFEKLPLLDLELKQYLEDPEISFIAVGDAHSDNYPLQVQKFSKGRSLVERLKALRIEGGGGGGTEESYDLAALYCLHNVEMPHAVKPLCIFIGDEGLYKEVNREHAKTWSRVNLEQDIRTEEVIRDLKTKFSVYCIRKLYDETVGEQMSATDRMIHRQWQDYLGNDHVAILPEPRRVVDVILGVIALETEKLDHFTWELTSRQRPEQVATVIKTMQTMHAPIIVPQDAEKTVHERVPKKRRKDASSA